MMAALRSAAPAARSWWGGLVPIVTALGGTRAGRHADDTELLAALERTADRAADLPVAPLPDDTARLLDALELAWAVRPQTRLGELVLDLVDGDRTLALRLPDKQALALLGRGRRA
ncbi:MAG: hypothetical protein GXX90_00165 [Microbacteriaceae bacterium]|nr:hypothetical protein [Microbacteriaceae bacterium]